VVDVVAVTDADGRTATAPIHVGPGVTVTPGTGKLWPYQKQAFTATGGGGTFTYNLTANSSGGHIDANGNYTAGPNGGTDDGIEVLDALGNRGTASIHVIGTLAIDPPYTIVGPGETLQLNCAGGQQPLDWKLTANPSGGQIDATGNYVSGQTTGSDVVTVTDAAGNVGMAAVRVHAPAPGGFMPAPHQSDQVENKGGLVLDIPLLVTITYSNDPQRKNVEKLGQYLVHSNWLQQVGAEYGVGMGNEAEVELNEKGPTDVTDNDIQGLIAGWIADGTVPTDPNDEAIYAFYVPPNTHASLNGQDLCTVTGGGYHGEGTTDTGTSFTYAVLAPCPQDGFSALQILQLAAAHEFMEAATDPRVYTDPAYYDSSDPNDPWNQIGAEIGDLCTFAPNVLVDGFLLQTIWSNESARSGQSPCVPEPGPYYSVSASPWTMQPVAAGQSITFTLTGWSTAALAPWTIQASASDASCCVGFNPMITLGTDTLGNGDTTTLTITVPADAPSQSAELIYISSSQGGTDEVDALVGVFVP
jgi:hypothetical protein